MRGLSASEELELGLARARASGRLHQAAYAYARSRDSVTKRVRDACARELEDAACEFASVEG